MTDQQSPENSSLPALAAETTIVPCTVCGKPFPIQQTRAWVTVRPNITAQIIGDHPQWQDGLYICHVDFAKYRRRHIEQLLVNDEGEISDIDQKVVDSFVSGATLAQAPSEAEAKVSFGDNAADKVAAFGGSWRFILTFSSILVIG